MQIDCLIAEIGSTTTTVSAFDEINTSSPKFLGQGAAPTSVLEGDVRIGLNAAKHALCLSLGAREVSASSTLASSSAAGGLKMTVHGLVHDMTARAAKEAALGAGAIVRNVTSGVLRSSDLDRVEAISPNIILLAGGVDYGERETSIVNAKLIAERRWNVPVIYAGNVVNRVEVQRLFEGTSYQLHIAENVYPKIDILNVEPTRALIQNIFEDHIVDAPGMEHIRELVDGPILPTPGAVMSISKLLQGEIGDLVVVDVGGATTDIHSACNPSDEIERIMISPEPFAKRTVEGDLGVYVNRMNVADLMSGSLAADTGQLNKMLESLPPIPSTEGEIKLAEALAATCVAVAMGRHAGSVRSTYGLSGKQDLAEGKDLTSVRYIIGTGGALTRLPGRHKLTAMAARSSSGDPRLLPSAETEILIDHNYLFSSLGVLAEMHPEAATTLAMQSLEAVV